MTDPFTATHTAPDAGLDTWPEADPTAANGPRIPGGLPIAVVERSGAWARVRCSNGWEAWVDGRFLPATPAGASPAGPIAMSVVDLDRSPLRVGRFKLSGLLVGAVAAVAACFLPWLSPNGQDVGAFDIPLRFLFDDKAGNKSGPKVGWVLIVAAAVIVVLIVREGPRIIRRVAGWTMVVVATLFVAQSQRAVGHAGGGGVFAVLGLGVFAAAGGGLLVALGSRGES